MWASVSDSSVGLGCVLMWTCGSDSTMGCVQMMSSGSDSSVRRV